MMTEEDYLRLQALQLRVESGDAIPECFEFEGKLLDTGKVIEKLMEFCERDLAQSGGVS